MRLTKFFAAALMVGALSMPAMAQNEYDPQAKAVLEKVTTNTKACESIRASFDWTMENKAEKTKDTKSGHMFIKGDKYKLILGGQEIFSDGTTMWQYSKDANEIEINEVDESDESIVSNPTKIFNLYEKGFKYQLKDQKNVAVKVKKDGKVVSETKACSIVDLYPESPKGKGFHTVELVIEKATSQIRSITIKFKNGTDQIIEITEYKTNVTMPDALFTYDPAKYPGAEVNDMR